MTNAIDQDLTFLVVDCRLIHHGSKMNKGRRIPNDTVKCCHTSILTPTSAIISPVIFSRQVLYILHMLIGFINVVVILPSPPIHSCD